MIGTEIFAGRVPPELRNRPEAPEKFSRPELFLATLPYFDHAKSIGNTFKNNVIRFGARFHFLTYTMGFLKSSPNREYYRLRIDWTLSDVVLCVDYGKTIAHF